MIFDVGGAMFGLCNLAGLVGADGYIPGSTSTFLAASVGTALGSLTGTTPLIIAAESAVGESARCRLNRRMCAADVLCGQCMVSAVPEGWPPNIVGMPASPSSRCRHQGGRPNRAGRRHRGCVFRPQRVCGAAAAGAQRLHLCSMPSGALCCSPHAPPLQRSRLDPPVPLQAIPQLATAPVLVLVGAFMLGECVHIDWSCILTAIPAFLTIVIQAKRAGMQHLYGRGGCGRARGCGHVCAETSPPFRLLPCALQPFTFSIANGIYAGLLMSALLHLLTGKAFEPLLRRRAAGDTPADSSAAPADVETPLLGGAQRPPPAVAPLQGLPIAIGAALRGRPSTPSETGSDRHSLGGDARSFTLILNTSGPLNFGSLGSLRGNSLTARRPGGGPGSAGGPPSPASAARP